MLKKLFFVTESINRELYENTYGFNTDILKDSLHREGVSLKFVYSPEMIDEEMLKKESMVITDDRDYLESFKRARGNVTFFSRDGFIPWGVDYVILGWDALNFKEIEDAYLGLIHASRQIFETKRLTVRESTVDDVDDFYRIYAGEGVTEHTEDLFKDPEDEKRYMEKYIREIYGFYGFGIWTLVYKETGEVIGRAGISMRDGYDSPEIGYILDKNYWGMGLAYEACMGIIDHVRQNYDFDSIQALCKKENEKGIGLLKKLGFQYEKDVKERGSVYQKYNILI